MTKSIKTKIAVGAIFALVLGLVSRGAFADTDTTPPSTPASLSASAFSVSQINLSWASSTDNVGVAGYTVFRNGSAVATTTALTYSDMALVPATTYVYTVNAFDAAGNLSVQSASSSMTTLADVTAPSIPTGLAATAVSASQINLGWAASTDNVAVAGYEVFRNGTRIATTTATSFSDSGLGASTTYVYTIAAYDAAGNASAQSAGVNGTTLVLSSDTTAPSVPTGLSATAVSASQINLSWTASTDNVAVAGYKIYRNGTQVATTTAVSFADTSLLASTNYSYAVAAFDAAGNISAQSANVNATTLVSGGTTPPPAPAPHLQPPTLQINPGGHFVAHGMTVTSVGTNSFQAQIWGITYTINVGANNASGSEPEFFLRVKGGGKFDITQLKVGDEVNASGKIDASAPLVVNADVVRDFSLVQLRPKHNDNEGDNGNHNGNKENGNEGNQGAINGSTSITIGSSSLNVSDTRGFLQRLLDQLKGLQDKAKGHGKGN